MNGIVARRVVNSNGEEIIELDLNKPWPSRSKEKYSNYMDEVERLCVEEKRTRKINKEFIKILH
jgi:hypothetical protein